MIRDDNGRLVLPSRKGDSYSGGIRIMWRARAGPTWRLGQRWRVRRDGKNRHRCTAEGVGLPATAAIRIGRGHRRGGSRAWPRPAVGARTERKRIAAAAPRAGYETRILISHTRPITRYTYTFDRAVNVPTHITHHNTITRATGTHTRSSHVVVSHVRIVAVVNNGRNRFRVLVPVTRAFTLARAHARLARAALFRGTNAIRTRVGFLLRATARPLLLFYQLSRFFFFLFAFSLATSIPFPDSFRKLDFFASPSRHL
jgi:hypothetical protein